MYTCYELSEELKASLIEKFPPKYSRVLCDHVTIEFGVTKTTCMPSDTTLEVIGYVDTGDGLECFLVRVNDSIERPDGKYYHITHSLDPTKYKPVNSNTVLKEHVVNSTYIAFDDSVCGEGIGQLNY